MMQKMVMKFIEPYLGKIPAWLEDLATEYEMEECYLMIRSKTDAEGKKKPSMLVMGKKNGGLSVAKDKVTGKEVEFGVESLMGLKMEDED